MPPATSRQSMKKIFIPLFLSLTIEPPDLLFSLIFTREARKLYILIYLIYLYISLFMEGGFFPAGGQHIPVHEEKSATGTIRHL